MLRRPQSKSASLLGAAYAAYVQGSPEQALSHLQTSDGDFPEVNFQRAKYLFSAGRSEEALRQLHRAIMMDANYAWKWGEDADGDFLTYKSAIFDLLATIRQGFSAQETEVDRLVRTYHDALISVQLAVATYRKKWVAIGNSVGEYPNIQYFALFSGMSDFDLRNLTFVGSIMVMREVGNLFSLANAAKGFVNKYEAEEAENPFPRELGYGKLFGRPTRLQREAHEIRRELRQTVLQAYRSIDKTNGGATFRPVVLPRLEYISS